MCNYNHLRLVGGLVICKMDLAHEVFGVSLVAEVELIFDVWAR